MMVTEDSVTLTHPDDSGQTVTPDSFTFYIVNKLNELYGFAASVAEIHDLHNLFSMSEFFKKDYVDKQNRPYPNLLERTKNARAEFIEEHNFFISTAKVNLSNISNEIHIVPVSDTKRRVALYSASNGVIRLLRDLEAQKHAMEITPLFEDEILSLIDAMIREKMGAKAA